MLNLVDLAGSERLARSGSSGERLKETQVRLFLVFFLLYCGKGRSWNRWHFQV